MSLTNAKVQSLEFGDTASNSTLIRTDKFGISLDRDITVNNSNAVNTAVNNVVLLANDKLHWEVRRLSYLIMPY